MRQTKDKDRLSEKQKLYVAYYCGHIQQTVDAMIKDGHSIHIATAERFNTNPDVVTAIQKRDGEYTGVMTRKELQEFWTQVSKGQVPGFGKAERVKCTELLGKSNALFTDKVVHDGGENPIKFDVQKSDLVERVKLINDDEGESFL